MGKRVLHFIMFCAALALMLCACAPRQTDYYALFRGEYTAEVEGSHNGVPFAAVIKAEKQPEAGVRPVTVTFYAPDGLKGAILRRAEEGAVSLSVGGVTLQNPVGEGFLALLELFPTAGEVSEVRLDEAGHTRVQTAGHTLTFLPDGTPYSLTTPITEVRVISFLSNGA